ncbi:MAG: iron ABC transporter permease [Rikenellaceae bacterium]
MPRSRTAILFVTLSLLVVILFTLDMMTGAVKISPSDVWGALIGGDNGDATAKIVRNIRFLKALVAIIAGVALPISGLQMQTLFRNPLAGPYTLGVCSGASLGVAIFIIGAPFLGTIGSSTLSTIGVAGAAWIGSAAILLLLATVGNRIKDIMVILILGMMFSSGVGAVVQVLQYFSGEERLKAFVVWTMGSLGDVTSVQIMLMLPIIAIGVVLSISAIKSLNMLLLGENYARTMGLNIRSSRRKIFISTTLLAGTITAFCGPIGFIGLAVPHIARTLFNDADHRILMPASALTGAVVMLLCDIVAKVLALPINTITSLIGIPIVVWIVVRNKTIA